MTIDAITIGALAVIFVSSVMRSTFGFGDAMMSMPLLSMLLTIHTATPLVALIAVTVSLAILARDWRRVHLQSAWRLALASCAGIPFGLLLLTRADERIVMAILAVVIIAFAAYQLFHPRLLELKNDRWAFAFGFVAGILGGAYNTQGPPLVMYGTMRNWSAESFRATLQGFFLPTSMMILAGHYVSGLWERRVFELYFASLPVLVVAIPIGWQLHQRIHNRGFVRGVYIVLVGIGILLLVSILRR
jgi:uncharacterized membrane protein YfcA